MRSRMKAVWPRVFGILCLVRPVWGGSHILTPSFSVYPVYPDQPPDYFSFPAFPNGVATYAAGDSVGAALIAPPGWQLSISITYVAATLGSAFCFISRNNVIRTAVSGVFGNTSSYGPYEGGALSVALFASITGVVSTGCTFSAVLTKCPAGSYCLNMTDPIACPVGNRCPLGSSAPIACGGGFYQDLPGQAFCAVCPSGSFCFVAPPDFAPIVSPATCPVGSYCPAGAIEPIACPSGYFGASTGLQTSYCSGPCPEGTYGAAPGLSSPACTGPCPSDYACPAGSTDIGTATQTGSASSSGTPSATVSSSQSPTMSPSVTVSHTATSSTSPTPSSSPSISQTPTQSTTQSQTRSQRTSGSVSMSPSQTLSPTMTLTATPSQTTTGFLTQPVIDNTNLQRNAILASPSEASTAALRFGVVLYWLEDDPVCGPGAYNLSGVVLALGMSSLAGVKPPLVFELWAATASAGGVQPLTKLAAYTERGKFVQNDPDYLRIVFPPGAFLVDTLFSRMHLLSWYYDDVASPGLGVSWYSAKNGLDGLENGGLPVRGLAQPAASAASVDGGATWAQTSLYGGILVMGAKIRCSPTPSPTASSSQSATGSQLQSPSQSSSPSSSGSRSNSASAAATASQTSSESATASLTASLSGSSSSTPSPTVSASETGTSSCSSTLSPSTSGTASQSATLTISASISVTPSSTSTRSATGSGTTSSTPSSTLSPSSRRTFSTTRTPSRTGPVSLTSSPTQLSASSTGTVSAFPSDSGTSSEIPTPSSTISATLSISQSRTVSGSRTLSLSPSHSITVLLAADNCTPDSNSINCSAFGGAASGALSGSSLPSTAVVTGAAIGGLFLLLLVVLLVLMLLCIFRRQKEQTATAAAETDVAGIAAPKSHPGASTAGVVSSWMQSPAVTAPIQPIATPVLRDAAASVDAVPCAESPKATYVAAGTVPAGQTPASKANASGAPVNVTSDAPPVALVVESPVRVGVQSQSIARDQATDNVSAATAFATRERNTPRTAIESGVRGPGRAKGHLRGDTGIAQASAVAIEAVVHVSTSGVAIATPHVGSAVDNGHAGVKVVAAPPLVAGSAVVDGVPPTAVAVAVAIPVQVVAADPTTADAVLEAIPAPNTQPVAADSIGTHLSAPAALSGVPPIKPAAVVTSRVGPVGVIVVAPDVTAAVFAAPRGADAASAPRRIDVSSRRRVTAAPKQAIRDRPRASPSTRGMSTSRLNERMVAGSSSTKLHSESTAPADATGESLRPDSIVRPAISTTSIVNVTAPVCQRPSAEASSPPSRIAPSQMGSSSHVVSAAPPALDGSGPRDCNAVSVAASVIATPPSADDSPPASAASPAQGEGACILEVASGCDDGGSAGSVSREQPQTSRGLPHQEAPQSGTLSSRPSGAATAATERTMPGWASRVRSLQARLRDDKPSRGLVEGSALPSSRYLSPASSSHASAEAAAAALLFDSTASPSGSRTLRMQRGDGSGGVDSEPGIGGTGGRGDALSLPSDSIAAPHGTSSGLPGLARSRTAASPLSPASVRPENTIAYLAGSADVDLPGSASVSSPFQPNSSSSTPAEGAPPPRSLLARSGSSVSVRGRGMLVAFPDSDRRRPPGSVNSRVSPSAQLSPLRSRSPEARRLPHTRSSPPATSPTSKSQFVIVRSGLLLRKPESGQPPDPV